MPVVFTRYATQYHAPVLCKTVTEELITDRSGIYVDATLGGGGHTAALLDVLSKDGKVLGIDQDEEAIEASQARLYYEIDRGRLSVIRGNFGDLEHLLDMAGMDKVNGVLADLGVSSHQLDTPERGFSFLSDGHLDMRMDAQSGNSAYEVVNEWSLVALRRIFFQYGEEPRSSKIAKAIVEARPIETTRALADVVQRGVPHRDTAKTLARIFQAIRIEVNDEMKALERILEACVHVIKPDGRMVVISYHSLEDRRVKRFFRYGNLEGKPVRDLYGHLITPWRELTQKPVMATEAEISANSRARSARVRCASRSG